jgi:hypothetical protein
MRVCTFQVGLGCSKGDPAGLFTMNVYNIVRLCFLNVRSVVTRNLPHLTWVFLGVPPFLYTPTLKWNSLSSRDTTGYIKLTLTIP